MSFENPIWDALQSKHRHFAICAGEACRYPADVAPFAAVRRASQEAMRALASLLAPGEAVWLVGDSYPKVNKLIVQETLECLQMVLPEEVTPPESNLSDQIVRLTAANGAEMVALTDVAFPGFYRRRTHEMGSYFGIRQNGELIAMGGERLMLDGYGEISGVCSHPLQRGKGLATNLIWHLVRLQRRNGLRSFLHVTCANKNAIRLYIALGFQERGRVLLTRHVAA